MPDVLTIHFGPEDVLVALNLDFDDERTAAAEVEQTVTRIEQGIKADHLEVTRVFVEAQAQDAHRRDRLYLEEG